MALNKKITERGEAITSYHKIKSISIDLNNEETLIELENYTSKEYRDKAKEQVEIKKKITELVKQYNSASQKKDRDIEKAILEKLVNIKETRLNELNIDYVVSTSFISLDEIPEEFTLASFYNMLTSGIYKGAKEV